MQLSLTARSLKSIDPLARCRNYGYPIDAWELSRSAEHATSALVLGTAYAVHE
jgi:hypothetical protein